MMFLWALHYPTGAQYRVHSSTCTAPRWVGHCTQHCFQEKDFPFPSHPSHMSFIIISSCYNKDLPVILSVMHTLSSSRHLLFLKNASAGPQVAETIYRHRRNAKEEECEFINIYISIICFLHGHIFRSGLLRSQSTYTDISAASNASLTSWRNTTLNADPTLLQRPWIMKN